MKRKQLFSPTYNVITMEVVYCNDRTRELENMDLFLPLLLIFFIQSSLNNSFLFIFYITYILKVNNNTSIGHTEVLGE